VALGLMRLMPAALADSMWLRVYGLDGLGSPGSA
jgi:hypothetical protein